MDRQWKYPILTSILLLQTAGIAHADVMTPAYHITKEVQAPPVEPVPTFEGTARIAEITRQNGGEVYKFDLSRAVPLTQLKIKPAAGRVKIIEVTLVTEKNERIPVRALSNVTLSASDPALPSEVFSLNIGIATIEFKAEAMGGAAALDIKAISNKEAPQLTLREEVSCKQKIDTILKEKLEIIQRWAARIEGSAPGSIQEKYAIKEFNKYVEDFIVTVKTDNASYASTDYTLVLLNFFADRYNASREGSAAEVAYRSMATETFGVLLTSIQSSLPCRAVSSEGIINIALDFQKKSEVAKAESRAGKLYETMIIQLGKITPSQYSKELATKNYDFRSADTEGNKYYKLYTTSKPENILKNTQRDMSLAAYAVAEKALLVEVKQMDNEKKYQLIVEFQNKYNDPKNFNQETMMKYLMILSEQGTLFRINL